MAVDSEREDEGPIMHLLLFESTDVANNLGDATLYRCVGKYTL
jgi:hypothetical protein